MSEDDPSDDPRRADAIAWWAAGSSLFREGKWVEAAKTLKKAVAAAPDNAALWSDLGAAAQYAGDLDAAAGAYQRSLALQPGNLSALVNFGFLLVQKGEMQQALELLGPQLHPQRESAPAWLVAGHAYRSLGDSARAVEAFQQAVILAPTDLTARHNLGISLFAAGKLSEAEALVRELLSKEPGYAGAWQLLASIEQAQGRADEAMAAYQRSLALAPEAGGHSNFLLALQYSEDVEPIDLLAAHRQWDAIYAQGLDSGQTRRSTHRDSARQLRIGFVSPQFGQHPIGYLGLRATECLDRSQCQVFCYSGRKLIDPYTLRFQKAADVWRATTTLSAEQLAAQIRADEIDILIDLMGHTSPMLLTFACRPAPLQISWLGYVGTTGMAAMDCLLADSYHVRPGEEGGYNEKVLRLPNGYACYEAPVGAPAVGELPALKAGYVTFGCFNNPAKFSSGIIGAWAEILSRVPSSRLLLRYFGLEDRGLQDRLRSEFSANGIEPARVLLVGQANHDEMLASYQHVDLALDTQPYSGGLTTCESLWMGVPVITFPGKTFAGRHSTSYLMNAGFGQFVARDRQGYVDLAIEWASRLDELAVIRSQMREQMRRSPLCDAPRFANDLLSLIQLEYRSRLEGRGSP